MSAPSARVVGIACAIGGVVAFSLKAVVAKLIYGQGVDVVTLMALRMSFSLPFFAGVAWWIARHHDRSSGASATPIGWREAVNIVLLGIVGYYGSSLCDFLGLQYVSAAVGRLVLFAYPTLTVLLSWVVLRKRATPRELTALALTYAGVALVLSVAIQQPGVSRGEFALGALLIFGAAVGTAVFLVFSAETIKRVGSMRFTAYAMTAAALPAILQFPLLRPWSALDLPLEVHGLAVLLAVGCTVLPIFLTSEGLKRLGANTVALYGGLGPLITIGLGLWLLGESMRPAQWVGAVAVIGGVLLVTIQPVAKK